MDVPEKKRAAPAAVAVAAVAVRACDGCARRRARWYCAADVAFLCQSCDASVHSANPVARRHHRVRLKAAYGDAPVPSWQRGFKRRARTPRQPCRHEKTRSRAWWATLTVVPETSLDEAEEEEEQLLYCVPVFEPALEEFCSPPSSRDEAKPAMEVPEYTPASAADAAFVPSEMELAEFAADMESLLGGGLEAGDNYFTMEKLGLVDSTQNMKTEKADDREEQRQVELEIDIDASEETPEIDSGWLPGSSSAAEENFEEVTEKAKLRLDYEAVITEWSRHGASPWTDGERPEINLDGCWPDHTDVLMGGGEAVGSGEMEGGGGRGGQVDEGRQERVTRYREKRRMRLFSKKIRYEVRKLNAEKRPRMKGRFVKCAPVPKFGHCH